MAGGDRPQEQRQQRAGRGRQDHGAEAAPAVGEVARDGATEDGGGVEEDKELVGEGFGEALVEGVRGDVGDGDEERELEEEDGGRGCGVDLFTQGEEVDDCAALYVCG